MLTGKRHAEIMNDVKFWRRCSLDGCHCHDSEMLHVETPEGTMYGPREVMEAMLDEMQSPAGRRPVSR